MKIRFVDAGTVSGMRSQTIYHGLSYAQTAGTPNTVVLATPGTPYMCIGFFQDAENELDMEYCRKQNLPVIRRETGGGAVYIDKGQLFVQWVFQKNSLPRRVDQRFQLFIQPLVETYKFFGIDAYYHPINDVHVGGKKIVGTGAGTIGDAEVVTGNFLFDFNYSTMINAINVPTDAFRQQVKHDLGQYLTTIQQELMNPPGRDEIIEVYRRQCEATLGVRTQLDEFTDEEIRSMEKLDEKFSTGEWLFQVKKDNPKDRLFKIHSGVWIAQTYHSFTEGSFNILSTMNDDVLQEIHFAGKLTEQWNFNVAQLEERLAGLVLDQDIIRSAIDGFVTDIQCSEECLSSVELSKAVCQVKTLQLRQSGHGAMAEQSN
jgi:lipoate-protein ligase A